MTAEAVLAGTGVTPGVTGQGLTDVGKVALGGMLMSQGNAAQAATASTAATQQGQSPLISKGLKAGEIPSPDVIAHKSSATYKAPTQTQRGGLQVDIPTAKMAKYMGTGIVGAKPAQEKSFWREDLTPEQVDWGKQQMLGYFRSAVSSLTQSGMGYSQAFNTALDSMQSSAAYRPGTVLDRFMQRRQKLMGTSGPQVG